MADTFEEMYRSIRVQRGYLAGVRFVLRAMTDVVVAGVAERLVRALGRESNDDERADGVRLRMTGGEGSMFKDLQSDIRFSLRTLRRAPGLTGVLVLTLALGIGANTAIFSVLNGVLFRPLPYDSPSELVMVWHTGESGRRGVSGPDLQDYMDGAESFSIFASANALGTNLTGDGPAEKIVLSWVTPGFFELLGAEASVGRVLTVEDQIITDRDVITRPGYVPPPVATVLSHGLWQRRFGEDPSVVGRTLEINGQRMNVIGVMPPSFRLLLGPDAPMPTDIDAWTLMPVALTDFDRGGSNLTVLGRLAPGAGIEQAQEEMDRFAQHFRDTYPSHARLQTEVQVASLHDEVVGSVRPFLWILFGAVGLVLVIACANVASLLLVRASAREQEFAVRAALGGGRGRIVRQLLTESLVVALIGSLLGLIVADLGIGALLTLTPGNLPRVDDVGIDRTVLMFTMGVTVLASIVFGLVPAVRTSRARPALSGRGGSGGGRERANLRSGLIVAEVALSVVLVVAAGLLARSFLTLQRVDPGFDADNVVTVNVSLPFFQYRDADRRLSFHSLLGEAVADIPGVESAGAIAALPLSGRGGAWITPFALSEGDEAEWEASRADYRPVMPGYFEAMKTTTLLGRTFDRASNEPDAAPVIIVDHVFAQAAWGGADPVGRRVHIVVPSDNQLSERIGAEVIGVVEHVRHTDLTQDGIGTIYLPYRLNAWFESSLVLRTTGDPAGVGAAVRAALAEIDPSVPAFDVRRMDDYVADALAPTRFAMILPSFFAIVALLLAAVGLYGIISTAVQQRSREIGVRIAMGAERKGILRLVVGQGLGLTLMGIGIGLAVAALASRAVSALLFGVAPTDPVTFVAAAIGLGIVAVLACYVPAAGASRVDPVVALRTE